jgi:hypothetical protein
MISRGVSVMPSEQEEHGVVCITESSIISTKQNIVPSENKLVKKLLKEDMLTLSLKDS